ncbi:MAG: hypothetical protein ISN29_01415 [Gammaproteobacteria bacterium AqS3]|nr:hypothetical protein [Gammaproteobacteria bacterium AqS3]
MSSDASFKALGSDRISDYSLTIELTNVTDNSRGLVVGYNFSDYFSLQVNLAGGDFGQFYSGQISYPIWDRVSPLIDIGFARYSDEDEGFTFSDTVSRIGLGLDVYFESSTLQMGWYTYGDMTFDATAWGKAAIDSNLTQASMDIETTAIEVRYLYNF